MSYKDYEAVIGLEIHAQLKTQSKIFCSCSTDFEAGDNQNTCPICTGQPGALPTINKKALELAVKVGRALNCEIDMQSVFERKNYFYPDMPRGYQISQLQRPICKEGYLEFYQQKELRKIRIERAHLEEDAGKSSHVGGASLINLNRASVPLLEIVSAPELRSPSEAAEYARSLRRVLRYLDVCDGNLEEGSMRCDCNVSVKKVTEKQLGTKVEIKNINSFRFVEKAIQFEIERQIDSLESGQKIVQETRLYDIDKNQTFTMRLKESSEDYRYFPEPDLFPATIKESELNLWSKDLPEQPLPRLKRFREDYGLSAKEAEQLTAEKALADFFEEALTPKNPPKTVASWILMDLFAYVKKDMSDSKISAKQLGELIEFTEKGEISRAAGKKILEKIWNSSSQDRDINQWIDQLGLRQMQDEGLMAQLTKDVFNQFPDQVEEYRQGKEKVFGFLVGQVIKNSKGKANPKVVKEELEKLFAETKN